MTHEPALRDASDERLLELARRDPRDPRAREAASVLLGRHQRRVYLWCRRYVRDHERALDASQDVLVSAYRALATFEGRSRFTSWLFTIARHRCLKAIAAPRWLRDEDAETQELPDPGRGPEARFEEERDERRLLAIIERHLEPDEREALWMRCFDRMPVEEIGRAMRLDNATGARALLQRARRRLRSALARAGEEGMP